MKLLVTTSTIATLAMTAAILRAQTPAGGNARPVQRPFEIFTAEGQPIDKRPPQLDTDHPVFPGQTHAPYHKTVDVSVATIAGGLDNPWAVQLLPSGRFLITEKPGRMRIIEADGRLSAPLGGLPPVDNVGQCGLLDVAVDPKFASNGLVYWSYAEAAAEGSRGNGTVLARGRLVGLQLLDVRVLFSQSPKVASRLHCGSRIVFDRGGRIWLGLGDRFSLMEEVQSLANHIGKVVRIDTEGEAPADNPFVARAGAKPEIWSLGHRNIQGMAMHPQTGELWASEHGPQGGDEINLVEAGRNYGWPLVTYGRNYGSGTTIGEEGPKAGYEMPLKHWVPISVTARSTAARCASNRSTVLPACAAICAMPLPMAPAPMTPTWR